MSEIIRDAYERAIVEKYPISEYMDTEYFEDSLRKITDVFDLCLEDILDEFSIKENIGDLPMDDYLMTWVIKKCLPNNPLYQTGLVLLTSCEDTFHLREKTYRLHILSQKENLKLQNPIWVWENKEYVDEFMCIDNPIYRKLKIIESLFPINVIIV